MIVLSVLLLAAAAVMIPFGLASDQGDGLIWGAVASTVVALVLLAVGLRRQARSGKLASVPPWAMPEAEKPAQSAADTLEKAPGDDDGGDDGESFQRPRKAASAKRVGVKRTAKKATAAKKAGAKKAGGAKKAATKKAAGAKKTGAKKTGARKASAAKKS